MSKCPECGKTTEFRLVAGNKFKYLGGDENLVEVPKGAKLYHGTTSGNISRILSGGLNPGYYAGNQDDASIYAGRYGFPNYVLEITFQESRNLMLVERGSGLESYLYSFKRIPKEWVKIVQKTELTDKGEVRVIDY